jgi:hypothetical protein
LRVASALDDLGHEPEVADGAAAADTEVDLAVAPPADHRARCGAQVPVACACFGTGESALACR